MTPSDTKNVLEDSTLWQGVREGERKALSELFCRHYQGLYNYGMRLTPARKDLVREAIQALFFKIWNAHQTLGEAQSVKAYLLSSLRRILIRKLNQERRRSERNYKFLELQVDSVPSIEERITCREIAGELKNQIDEVCGELSSRQREILLLRYDHGLTNKEISEVLQIEDQTVRNHLSRALGNIREKLSGYVSVDI